MADCDTCEEAIKRHKDEHARSQGTWHAACAEGWCGCAKDCGRSSCPVCPTPSRPA